MLLSDPLDGYTGFLHGPLSSIKVVAAMDEYGAKYFREREAEARNQADHAATRSIQILRLKSAEHFGALAYDAEQKGIVTNIDASVSRTS
ncbi:hypothetical protein [Sphingomonas sp. CROZ-RG-20F-R02-07]|uniref:hypothetical protein n=1 Tax=Sphingomonas sp. CROZ-RG-20F-R02-07 TaxID=2914832 RepID=UPI001F564D0E|nr:hypothetical protein [Sphingomonas sp. CROZ-RG-20F-R02-07]